MPGRDATNRCFHARVWRMCDTQRGQVSCAGLPPSEEHSWPLGLTYGILGVLTDGYYAQPGSPEAGLLRGSLLHSFMNYSPAEPKPPWLSFLVYCFPQTSPKLSEAPGIMEKQPSTPCSSKVHVQIHPWRTELGDESAGEGRFGAPLGLYNSIPGGNSEEDGSIFQRSKVCKRSRSGKFFWDRNTHRGHFSAGGGLCVVQMGCRGRCGFQEKSNALSPDAESPRQRFFCSLGPVKLTTLISSASQAFWFVKALSQLFRTPDILVSQTLLDVERTGMNIFILRDTKIDAVVFFCLGCIFKMVQDTTLVYWPVFVLSSSLVVYKWWRVISLSWVDVNVKAFHSL